MVEVVHPAQPLAQTEAVVQYLVQLVSQRHVVAPAEQRCAHAIEPKGLFCSHFGQ